MPDGDNVAELAPINTQIKIPPFYKNNPAIWFRQLDAAFWTADPSERI